jgi:hypothetical protein
MAAEQTLQRVVLPEKAQVSLGVVSAMRDLRFVANEIKDLQDDELLPPDTAARVLPKLVADSARVALGLPAAEPSEQLVVASSGAGDASGAGATLSVVNSYSAGGIGLCLVSVAMLIGLDIANFVVMEIPPPVTWAVLLLLLSSAPLTHAAGTEMHDSYKFCQPLQGGNTYVLLQSLGWTIYGFICLLVLGEALHAQVLCPLFQLCQFKTLVSLHVSSGTPGLLLGISVCGLAVQLLLLASLNYYKDVYAKKQQKQQKQQQQQQQQQQRQRQRKQQRKEHAPAAAAASPSSSSSSSSSSKVQRDAAAATTAHSHAELSGMGLSLVRLANFLVCQNGLAHMFECPLTWWRPPRNFDLEHSMTYMFDPVSQWVALAILWPYLKRTASGQRALFGLAVVGSGHVLSIWGQYLSFGGITATHNWNVFYTLLDTMNLLHCGFVIAQHKLLGPSDITATYMLALASFFMPIHLDFVDFLTLLTASASAMQQPDALPAGGVGGAGGMLPEALGQA